MVPPGPALRLVAVFAGSPAEHAPTFTPARHRAADGKDRAKTMTASKFSARGAVALVTGANRGIGRVFARELIDRGAARVYGGARNPGRIDVPGVVPIRLDITDPAQVAAAADQCTDLTLLVNNAGIFRPRPLLGNPSTQDARDEMETNFFGTLSMIRAFAPILGRNGGGAI